jgi:protein-S-isoprenylcysteine O-methyltransferase Ste14
MAALLFIPAGTLDYWQAWTFLAVYFTLSLALTLYLMKKDPKLLERRMRGGPTAEKEPVQKIIMTFASLGFIGLLVCPRLIIASDGLISRHTWRSQATRLSRSAGSRFFSFSGKIPLPLQPLNWPPAKR